MTRRPWSAPGRAVQRGAALLIAMLILTLVATVASAMVWHQHRAIEVEATERARAQAAWILNGALDWARLILREDSRTGAVDHLGEPWATPLSEARLSTFLAVDRDNTDSDLQAFLSGRITDAQARYNLRRLVGDDGKPVAEEVAALRRLCQAAGEPADIADRLADGLAAAWKGEGDNDPVPPARVSQLVWLGLEAATVARLEPYLVILPASTPINANTASREVLLAAIDGLDLSAAERIVLSRQRQPLTGMDKLRELLPQGLSAADARVGVSSRFFEVEGRLRLDERVLEERSLLERGAGRGSEVQVRRRERRSLQAARE